MSRLARRHPIAAYLLIAFGATWLATLPLIAIAQASADGADAVQAWHPVGAVGPAAGAFAIAWLTGGGARIRALIGSTVRPPRRAPAWWPIAALSPLPLAVLAWLAMPLGGNDRVAPGTIGEAAVLHWPGVLALLVVPSIAYGIGEEAGWRGSLLPRLQAHHRALTATLILGAWHAAWHLPFFFYRDGWTDLGLAGSLGIGFVILIDAIWMTWLFNSTGGSVFAVALWHATHSVVNIVIEDAAPAMQDWLGALVAAGVAVALFTGGVSRLSTRDKVTIDDAADGAGTRRAATVPAGGGAA